MNSTMFGARFGVSSKGEGTSESKDLLHEDLSNILLPSDGWKTVIIGRKIIEGEDHFPNVQIHFFVNIRTKEDFKKWLLEFENLTSSSYVITNTDIEGGPRVIFRQRLRCHHFTRCKKTYTPSLKNRTRNTNCPSKLTVKIHVIRKKYRGKQEKFDLIKELPCEITLVATHNHATGTADYLRFRKVSNTVREELVNLYQNGHTPGTALRMLKCHIQLNTDDYTTALADRNQCPSYKYCYDLYRKEFKNKYESLEFNSEAITFLQNKLAQYNNEQKDECAKITLIGTEYSDYVISICTPLMKRVHKHIEAASQIVFMDSSRILDRDGSRVFVLLTHSECGGLPLGLIITTCESVEAITSGFQMLKELLGESVFGGHEEGPKVFMTDDSVSQQKAIGQAWPHAKRLLCFFHVLHAVSRWLSKSKNGISKDHQTEIYEHFRNILYSNDIEEMTTNYHLAMKNAELYPTYINYLSNYWWPKRESWVKAFRNSRLIKRIHPNNYSESTIRQIKDQIFSRIRAFNVIQMVDFMITRFDEYNERKLLDASSNRLRKNSLYKEIKMPSSDLLQQVKKLTDYLVAVPSETTPNLIYLVNMEVLTCSCKEGLTTGSVCKHIDWANVMYSTDKYMSAISNYETSQKLYLVATGRTDKKPAITRNDSTQEPAMATSSVITVKKEDDREFSGEEFIGIDNVMESDDHEEEGIRYSEAMTKLNQLFDQFFEKSPHEVASSTEKMLTTLEKIKTPAAFASAVATFGFGE